jgi:hypothetical protein
MAIAAAPGGLRRHGTMGKTLLRDILANWKTYELDDSIYLANDEGVGLDTWVTVYPFDPMRERYFEGQHYFLGIEQLRDVVEGLESQLGRQALPMERLRAAIHYAKHDAFIDPDPL